MQATQPLSSQEWAYQFFKVADRINADEYANYFAPDGQLIFGNEPPVIGRSAIRQSIQQFFDTLSSMHHRISEVWIEGDTVISRAVAHYVRKADNQAFALPVVTIVQRTDAGVQQVQIYMDVTPLKQV